MKRIGAVLLVGVLGLGLSACGEKKVDLERVEDVAQLCAAELADEGWDYGKAYAGCYELGLEEAEEEL